jgi:glutathione S-transferase
MDAAANPKETSMLTIHGVPLSVHTRKAIVTAILKDLDYKFEVVIPVVPGNPPANWNTLSPTGLIPVLQDGGLTLGDSTAICLYLEKKQASTPVLPADAQGYARTLWFDAYAGGTIFRNVVHPLFHQTVVNPNVRKAPVDKAVVDDVLSNVAPRVFGYLEGEIGGKFLVGDRLTLADIAIVSNLIVYRYLGFPLDAGRYPKLSKHFYETIAGEAFQRALADEEPFVEQMGLDRSFLS